MNNVKFRDGSILLKQKNVCMSCSISYCELSALARCWINRDQMDLGDLFS